MSNNRQNIALYKQNKNLYAPFICCMHNLFVYMLQQWNVSTVFYSFTALCTSKVYQCQLFWRLFQLYKQAFIDCFFNGLAYSLSCSLFSLLKRSLGQLLGESRLLARAYSRISSDFLQEGLFEWQMLLRGTIYTLTRNNQ